MAADIFFCVSSFFVFPAFLDFAGSILVFQERNVTISYSELIKNINRRKKKMKYVTFRKENDMSD